MQVFASKLFHRWARKEGLLDQQLLSAVTEIQQGLVEANLGGYVYKKRVAIGGRGKSSGVRTLLAYQEDNRAIFIYGFAKNDRADIREDELRALKKYAIELLAYDDSELSKAVQTGALIEVKQDEKIHS